MAISRMSCLRPNRNFLPTVSRAPPPVLEGENEEIIAQRRGDCTSLLVRVNGVIHSPAPGRAHGHSYFKTASTDSMAVSFVCNGLHGRVNLLEPQQELLAHGVPGSTTSPRKGVVKRRVRRP